MPYVIMQDEVTCMEIKIKSTLDNTEQLSLFYKAEGEEKRPLFVGLHTWSNNCYNQIENMLPYAQKYNFNLLLPDFRGPNLTSNPKCTEACGSDLAKRDIKDAIDYVIENENVDPDNVFLLGLSGGGHMALLMAGYCPGYFKAIAAYVPITDLEKWAGENSHYRDHILACCSNDKNEMKHRSPVTYLDNIAKANLKICHGKYDPVVPVSHSLDFYNTLMEKYPRSRVFLDIFDGGHEIDMEIAMYWLMSQYEHKEITKVTG